MYVSTFKSGKDVGLNFQKGIGYIFTLSKVELDVCSHFQKWDWMNVYFQKWGWM